MVGADFSPVVMSGHHRGDDAAPEKPRANTRRCGMLLPLRNFKWSILPGRVSTLRNTARGAAGAASELCLLETRSHPPGSLPVSTRETQTANLAALQSNESDGFLGRARLSEETCRLRVKTHAKFLDDSGA